MMSVESSEPQYRGERGNPLADYIGFLHYLAAVITRLNGVPVVTAKCPECGGEWSAWKPLCPAGEDYLCGYRAVWRCENPECGEMELR